MGIEKFGAEFWGGSAKMTILSILRAFWFDAGRLMFLAVLKVFAYVVGVIFEVFDAGLCIGLVAVSMQVFGVRRGPHFLTIFCVAVNFCVLL